jgi:hypothetical protein
MPLVFESLRFYETGTEIGEQSKRQYCTEFPQRTARFIKFELRVKNLERQTDRTYRLMYRYFAPDGSLLGDLDDRPSMWRVQSTSDQPSYSWGRGWEEPGHWQPGAYRVEILIDGVEFAEEPFTITEDAAEPPPQAIPDITVEDPPETSAIDQSSTGIEERGEPTPPPWHADEGSSSALPAVQSGEDRAPSLTPCEAVDTLEQVPNTQDLPLQCESLRFDESGTEIGTENDSLIDEIQRAEEAFTIAEDAEEDQPSSEPPPSTHCVPSATHEEPPPDTSTAPPSSTGTEKRGEPTGRESGNIIELASYRHKHSEQEHASALPSPEATLEEPIPSRLSPALAPQPKIDEVVVAEGAFTITEDVEEQPPTRFAIPDTPAEEPLLGASAAAPASTGTDENGCVPETKMGEPGKTGEADTEHYQERQEPSRLLAPQDHLETTGETLPSVSVEVALPTTIPSPEAPVYELPDGVVVAEEAFTIAEDTAEPLPSQEQQPLTSTTRKKTPRKVPRAPVPGFQLASVHFYAIDNEFPPYEDRQYATHFSRRTVRVVAADVMLRNRLYKKRRQTFHMEVHYHNPDGTLMGASHYDHTLTSSYQEWGLSVGWGCDETEEWELGTYRVAILIDGVEIGEGSFTMTDSVELPSPPLVPSTTSAEPQPVSGWRQRERSSLSVIWDALAWYVKKLAGSGSA